MPAPLGASAVTGRGGFEQGKEVGLAIVWESEDLLHGVNRPAEDDLLCAPGRVAFQSFLRDIGFSCAMSYLFLGRNSLSLSRHLLSLCRPPLRYTDEVIEVYFDVS